MDKIFNQIISFSGSIDRSLYWKIFIPMLFINFFSFAYASHAYGHGLLLPGVIEGFIQGGRGYEILVPVYWVSYVSIVSLLVRRLRDINASVWWILPSAIHILLLLVVGIVLGLFPRKKE